MACLGWSCVHAVSMKFRTTESSSAIIALMTASVVCGSLEPGIPSVMSAGGVPVVVGVNLTNSAHDWDTDLATKCISNRFTAIG